MPISNRVILTETQKDSALALNPGPLAGVLVEPRLIDATNPGTGINLNDLADGVEPGAVVQLAGKYVANAKTINDPAWAPYPDMIALLLTCPICMVDSDIVFAPVVDQ